MKKQKGISLIVLVITILVMIILAGVVIVSLQQSNPIQKAKFARMVDSLGSVRGAISQYAANAQAHDSVEEDMKNLVDEDGYLKGGNEVVKDGKTVKDLLGVDPTPLLKEGKIKVDIKTGRTEYELNTDAYDEQIKESKPEGIIPSEGGSSSLPEKSQEYSKLENDVNLIIGKIKSYISNVSETEGGKTKSNLKFNQEILKITTWSPVLFYSKQVCLISVDKQTALPNPNNDNHIYLTGNTIGKQLNLNDTEIKILRDLQSKGVFQIEFKTKNNGNIVEIIETEETNYKDRILKNDVKVVYKLRKNIPEIEKDIEIHKPTTIASCKNLIEEPIKIFDHIRYNLSKVLENGEYTFRFKLDNPINFKIGEIYGNLLLENFKINQNDASGDCWYQVNHYAVINTSNNKENGKVKYLGDGMFEGKIFIDQNLDKFTNGDRNILNFSNIKDIDKTKIKDVIFTKSK